MKTLTKIALVVGLLSTITASADYYEMQKIENNYKKIINQEKYFSESRKKFYLDIYYKRKFDLNQSKRSGSLTDEQIEAKLKEKIERSLTNIKKSKQLVIDNNLDGEWVYTSLNNVERTFEIDGLGQWSHDNKINPDLKEYNSRLESYGDYIAFFIQGHKSFKYIKKQKRVNNCFELSYLVKDKSYTNKRITLCKK